jgi:ketosteroid isomerase-like protein
MTMSEVAEVIESWAKATRENRREDILANHSSDLVIFDVLAPMKYESAAEYRASWDDWQPETNGEAQFDIENLTITEGVDVAFAHSFIRCGGTMPKGEKFQDLVRATFCLKKIDGLWTITHQHVSKPIEH